MSNAAIVTWKIDSFDDTVGITPDMSPAEKALAHAEDVNKRFLMNEPWVFFVEIDGVDFQVDLETDKVTNLTLVKTLDAFARMNANDS